MTINNARIKELLEAMPTTVVQVYASYSGSCDSGEFDEISFLDEARRPVEVDTTVQDDFEDLFIDLLELEHCGWENNEGSSGTITLDIAARHIDIDHTQYHTESTQFSTRHTFTV